MKKLLYGLFAALAGLCISTAVHAGHVMDEGSHPDLVATTGVLFNPETGYQCSASVVRYDTILTAGHCLDAAKYFLYHGQRFTISGGGKDEITDTDTLYFRVDGYMEGPYAKVWTHEIPKDAHVVSIGYPGQLEPVVSEGKVIEYTTFGDTFNKYMAPEIGVNCETAAGGEDTFRCTSEAVTFDVPIFPGMSGGPVFMKHGDEWYIVGVNSFQIFDPFFGPYLWGFAPIHHLDWK